jgi:hypothetical protein
LKNFLVKTDVRKGDKITRFYAMLTFRVVDPDPDPAAFQINPDPTWIQGIDDKKLKKKTAEIC